MDKDFELLPHTADIKIRVYGKTLAAFFRNALVGMFQAIGPQVKGCSIENERIICKNLSQTHMIEIEAPDIDALVVDFLSEALYLSDVHDEAYLDAEVHKVSEKNIKATIKGVKVQGFEVVEIKAVTYHELEVKKVQGMWQGDIVFDI